MQRAISRDTPQYELASIAIRYDGLDAEQHKIDLFLLGESIQGVARVLATLSHFVLTKQYAKQIHALDVKVYVGEPRANCFSITTFVEVAREQQLFAGGIVSIVSILLTYLIGKSRNSQEEMKAIKDSLDKAVAALAGQNQQLVPHLLATIDRLAESLRPSLRAAVAPVGRSCEVMRIGEATPIDRASAEAIRATTPGELTAERKWLVRITELDLESATAKIRFVDGDDADEDIRLRAEITDPALRLLSNPYVLAFSSREPLTVFGKAILRDGSVQNLYISNCESVHP